MKKLLPALGFLGCILAANWVTTRYGMVPVGFGLIATAVRPEKITIVASPPSLRARGRDRLNAVPARWLRRKCSTARVLVLIS